MIRHPQDEAGRQELPPDGHPGPGNLFKKVFKQNPDDRGGKGSDDQQHPEPPEGVFQGGQQFPVVNGDDRRQGTDMQHRIQKQSRLIQTEEVAPQIKVSRAADRQKFRQPLDDSQYRRFQPVHRFVSFRADAAGLFIMIQW